MPGANCHLGCDRLLTLQHDGSIHTLSLQAFPFNEHAVYCADDDFCLYFANGNYKSNNCSSLSTAKVSGSVMEIKVEFVNFLIVGKWNFGNEIGRPESSLIQTADCPQVGGQMANMVQTTHSPVYGITDWPTCANICQGLSECKYWQWDEENQLSCSSLF